MGPRFDETKRGVKFFDRDLPNLIKAIQENTAELKRANDLKETEKIERERLTKGCWNEQKEGADNGNA